MVPELVAGELVPELNYFKKFQVFECLKMVPARKKIIKPVKYIFKYCSRQIFAARNEISTENILKMAGQFNFLFLNERSSKPYPTRDGLSHLSEACPGGGGVFLIWCKPGWVTLSQP